MKSLSRKDFISAGSVDKIHGTKGEIKVSLNQGTKIKEWVFMEIHGKPVPFFVEASGGEKEYPILKLWQINDPHAAQRLVGHEVLMPATARSRRTKVADLDITGYMLSDVNMGKIGEVTGLEELPSQLLIQCVYHGREILIPAVEEFIREINHDDRTVLVELPEGMIEL